MTSRLRVVIADDERPARSFLAALLRAFDDVAIVGEASSGKEAVAIIERERRLTAARNKKTASIAAVQNWLP